jgi:oligoribonuclease NrnB/cAMP/cGMP phosphodiesterase (DHH superfamily)
MNDVISGKAKMPIVYLTATKERIRWLSRKLTAALQRGEPVAWIEHHKAGDNLNWDQVDHSYAKATPLYK